MIVAAPEKPTLKQIESAEAAVRLAEQAQVLAQPHRNGSRSPLRECALGRFVEDYGCGSLCYDAGEAYRVLVYKWRKANGIPQSYTIADFNGGSGDLDPEQVRKWMIRIYDCNKAMAPVGTPGYLATLALILDDKEPVPWISAKVKRALEKLGIELGLIMDAVDK